jgi:hypothetical protein
MKTTKLVFQRFNQIEQHRFFINLKIARPVESLVLNLDEKLTK